MIGTALLAAAAAALTGWPPAHLDLGLASQPGTAAHVRALHARYRYQYLAGGVDTGNGWSTWNPGGTFVSRYVRESYTTGRVPVLTYYMMLQSGVGGDGVGGAEDQHDLANLADPAIMKAYFADLELALRRAREAAHRRLVILHVEPDLWGYVQQHATGDDPGSVPAAVSSSGDPLVAGLPDTAAGFAQAIVRLRDRLAPDVALGVHMSTWGTGVDPIRQDVSLRDVDRLAARSARFIAGLHARFDAVFSDPADRDDGYRATVDHDGGRSRWSRQDYRRDIRWLRDVHRATRLPIVMWQIPLGNRHENDTPRHYRDTHVQALLGDRSILKAYRNAGVVALLFGAGQGDQTTERTDGGLFKRLAARYAHRGHLRARR